MITSWRIVKKNHLKKAFTGEGARLYGGRWNPIGVYVIYTAESISLATLEIIVHLEKEQLIYDKYVKIPITFDTSSVFKLSENRLPKDWRSLPPSVSTQKFGQTWIEQANYAVMKVPSTIITEEYNFLINPNHPDFSTMQIGAAQRFEFNSRLVEI